jgi:hypothetical protein
MIQQTQMDEIKEILKEIYERGFDITIILKEQNKTILDKANSGKITPNELFADTNVFYYSLFESYWKLFKQVSENIENPLLQPWVRVFIEQACDIFLYNEKSPDEKEQLTYLYWSCAIGFSKNVTKDLNYDFFINLIKDPDKKQKFLDLKKDNFPSEFYNKTWHELFSAINKSNLPNAIEKYFFNLEDKSLTKEQIANFFGDMSLYHHPNILTINSLTLEKEDKSHLFRCFALMYLSSKSLIRFFAKDIIQEPNKILSEDIENKVKNIIKSLKESRRL